MHHHKHLQVKVVPPEARITLDRPPLNVLNMEMMEELAAALGEVENADGARVLVLEGGGKAFCAGVDVKDHMGDSAGPMLKLFHRVIRTLWHYRLPSVCALRGAALGGGCELALSCDVVIASREATLGQPEVSVGVFPPPAAVLFTRLAGLAAAKELLLTGRVFDSSEAQALGLINRVVEGEDLDGEVAAVVKNLSKKSLPVLGLTREAVLNSMGISMDDALAEAESLYLGKLMKLEDSTEGLTAFLEKRKPDWKDR